MTKRRGHGEGSIRQRSDGRWEGTINIGWRDGKRHRRSVYGKTRREAADKLTLAIRGHQLGIASVDERTRTETYLIRWCEESLPGTVKESTAVNYRFVLERYVIPHVGRIPLAKLGPADVQRMMRALEEKGLGVSVRRQARVILRRALGEALRWDLVTRNAAALVDAPKGARHRADALSQKQAETLLAACAGTGLEGVVTIALATGLRKGEVLGLRWENVNLAEQTVTVVGTLKRLPGSGLVLDTPKSSTSHRTIPLPAFCVATLSEHRRHQVEQRLLLGSEWQDTGYVFTTAIGTPLDPRNLTARFQALCESAGLGRIRFHALRHTAATLMLNNGVPLEVISATLGHSSYAITADIYAKVAPSLQRGAANVMDSILA